MALSIAIVGLPNVGKSTLFNVLTHSHILAANYPFATIEPNTGIVSVPDPRLAVLAARYQSRKVTPASVTFVDIAGLVAGASKGEGLGNQFLANIRVCNAIVHVVRAFEDSNVIHVEDHLDPRGDIDVINTELILADLQTVERRLPKLEKEAKADAKLRPAYETLQRVHELLDAGTPLSHVIPSDVVIPAQAGIQSDHSAEGSNLLKPEELAHIADLQLLTAKPVIYAFNVDEAGLQNDARQKELAAMVAPAQHLFVSAKLEDELQSLDEADAAELLESYGQTEPGLNRLIRAAYDTLGLQSYLTAGPDEVRAWTIHKGDTAPQAAGVIHGDFERGFIAAEVVSYPDFIAAGSMAAARAAGKVRTEGKTYVMQPDDIVEFRFNVSK